MIKRRKIIRPLTNAEMYRRRQFVSVIHSSIWSLFIFHNHSAIKWFMYYAIKDINYEET